MSNIKIVNLYYCEIVYSTLDNVFKQVSSIRERFFNNGENDKIVVYAEKGRFEGYNQIQKDDILININGAFSQSCRVMLFKVTAIVDSVSIDIEDPGLNYMLQQIPRVMYKLDSGTELSLVEGEGEESEPPLPNNETPYG